MWHNGIFDDMPLYVVIQESIITITTAVNQTALTYLRHLLVQVYRMEKLALSSRLIQLLTVWHERQLE